MGTGNFSDDFKRDAVAQITERGSPIREVSERLEVSLHSPYAWKRKFAQASSGDVEKDAEIRRLKRELARVSAPSPVALPTTISTSGPRLPAIT